MLVPDRVAGGCSTGGIPAAVARAEAYILQHQLLNVAVEVETSTLEEVDTVLQVRGS
jgi:hypothetical protein